MTVPSEDSRVSYNGAGSVGPFDIPFYFLADADIRAVQVVIATGAETALTLTTDYTLTGAADPDGGQLTLVTALPVTDKLVIIRDPDLLQSTDLIPNDDLPAESLERMVDKLTMLAQRTRSITTRSLRQPDGDADTIDELPAKLTRASSFLYFNADGNPTAAAGTTETPVSAAMEDVVAAATLALARDALGLGDLAVLDTVDTAQIDDDAVTTAKIDDDAVTTAKIDDDAVTTAKIDDGAVTPVKLSDLPIAQGRLTLTTGTPVTTSDVNSAGTVYFTPYKGNVVSLYDGSKWVPTIFTELSQATTDATKSPAAVANNSIYDMFVWNDSGTIRCTRGPAWSSATARGTGAGTTELEWFEGRYVNKVDITNGPAARRGLYVGSLRSQGSALFEDGDFYRTVWNYYNRVDRPLSNGFTTDRATTNDYPGEINAEIRLAYLIGIVEDAIQFSANVSCRNSNAGNTVYVSMGIDGTTAQDCTQSFVQPVNAYLVSAATSLPLFPSIGYHYATLLGGDNGGTTTWTGGAAGATRCTLKSVIKG